MGSTVMHLCLTKRIIHKFKIKANINELYIGSVVPDFVEVHKKTKQASHYIIEIEQNKNKITIPDIYLFLKTYKCEILSNNYLLGELIHLVSDRIWYSEYITKYVIGKIDKTDEIFDVKQNKYIPFAEFKEKIYHDYSIINQYYLKKYKIDIESIINQTENKDICKSIIKNTTTSNNESVSNNKNQNIKFKELNYIKKEDIEKWIKKSEIEVIKIINKLKHESRKGNINNMKIIVGLGNIGKEYEKTRHNVGFIMVDKISKKYGITISKKMKKCELGEGTINGKKVVLVKPTTFMNLSSAAIVEIKNWYKVENDDVLIIYDDIDIAIGDVRYREDGSAGTHNGMKDILSNLKTNQLSRIRIGIENRKGLPIPIADYVLSNFTKDELNMIETDIFTEIDEKISEFVDK